MEETQKSVPVVLYVASLSTSVQLQFLQLQQKQILDTHLNWELILLDILVIKWFCMFFSCGETECVYVTFVCIYDLYIFIYS